MNPDAARYRLELLVELAEPLSLPGLVVRRCANGCGIRFREGDGAAGTLVARLRRRAWLS